MVEKLATWGNPFLEAERPEETEMGIGDFGSALAVGATGLAKGAAALGDTVVGNENTRKNRDYWNMEGEAALSTFSDEGRKRFSSSFIPGDDDESFWDAPFTSAALKLTAATPSLIASALPGGLVGRALGATAGMLAGGGAGALINAGDVTDNIYASVERMSDAELREQSEMYDAYRSGGMDEKDARRAFTRDIVGYKPLVAAAITALTSKYGVEGLVARMSGGEAGKGFIKGAATGFLGESVQEALESSSGAYMQGMAKKQGGIGDVDWLDVLSQTVEGAAIGGLMGAPVGGVSGMANRPK